MEFHLTITYKFFTDEIKNYTISQKEKLFYICALTLKQVLKHF